MKTGPKPKPKTDGAKLPTHASGLSPAEQTAYGEIVGDLNRTGYGQACDLQAVVLAARRLARVRTIDSLVKGLDCLTVVGGNGQEVMHPFVGELRHAEKDLSDSLRILSLTPAARKSIRTAGREVDLALPPMSPEKKRIMKYLA